MSEYDAFGREITPSGTPAVAAVDDEPDGAGRWRYPGAVRAYMISCGALIVAWLVFLLALGALSGPLGWQQADGTIVCAGGTVCGLVAFGSLFVFAIPLAGAVITAAWRLFAAPGPRA